MKDQRFEKMKMAVLILGALSLLVITAYTVYLHDHCSIISYIANNG